MSSGLLENLKRIFIPSAILICCLGCAAVSPMTEQIIHDKVMMLEVGSDREKVLEVFGYPHYVTTIRHEGDLIEIYDYQMGHYKHFELVSVLMKNSKVLGVPRDSKEMVKFLTMMRVIENVSYWEPNR